MGLCICRRGVGLISLVRLIQACRRHNCRLRSCSRIAWREAVLVTCRTSHTLEPATVGRVVGRIISPLLIGEGGRPQYARTRRPRPIGTCRRGKLLWIERRIQSIAPAGWRWRSSGVHEELVVLSLRGAVGAMWKGAIGVVMRLGCAICGVVVGIVVTLDIAKSVVAGGILLVLLRRLPSVRVLLPVILPVRHGGRGSWERSGSKRQWVRERSKDSGQALLYTCIEAGKATAVRWCWCRFRRGGDGAHKRQTTKARSAWPCAGDLLYAITVWRVMKQARSTTEYASTATACSGHVLWEFVGARILREQAV